LIGTLAMTQPTEGISASDLNFAETIFVKLSGACK
jgi:hypothetical protein